MSKGWILSCDMRTTLWHIWDSRTSIAINSDWSDIQMPPMQISPTCHLNSAELYCLWTTLTDSDQFHSKAINHDELSDPYSRSKWLHSRTCLTMHTPCVHNSNMLLCVLFRWNWWRTQNRCSISWARDLALAKSVTCFTSTLLDKHIEHKIYRTSISYDQRIISQTGLRNQRNKLRY